MHVTVLHRRNWSAAITLISAALLQWSAAQAQPVVNFDVTVQGGQGGTYHTTWSQTGTTTATPGLFNIAHTNGPHPTGLNGPAGQWSIGSWNFNADDLPTGSGAASGIQLGCGFSVTNLLPEGGSAAVNHLQFTIAINMNAQYGGTCGTFFGNAGMVLNTPGGIWNAVISTTGNSPIWSYTIDGTGAAFLYLPPAFLSISAGGPGTSSSSQNLSPAQTTPLASIETNNIGIRLSFDLTPGESVTFNGIFAFIAGTIWNNANGGAFSTGGNWTNGLPAGSCYALFGSTQSANPYTVSFSNNINQTICSVTNQHPTFNLGGFQFSLSNLLSIGPNQPASLAITNGTLASPVTLIESFGTLAGDAAIVGDITNTGTMRPGRLDAAPPGGGVLTLNGSFVQQSAGVFESQFGIAENGRLMVNGNVTLAGTLRMTLLPGADPQDNTFYPVLSSTGTMTGTFGAAVLPFLGPDKVVSLQYVTGEPAGQLGDDGAEHNEPTAPGGGTDGASGVAIVIGSPNGSPDFDDPQTFIFGGVPTGITGSRVQTATVERDLALSIAAEDPQDSGYALILLNQGGGASFNPLVEPVGREPSGIVSAALADGTEADDFAVPNAGDDTVTVLFYDGANSFTDVTVPVGGAPSAITAADLDGDRLIDLAVTNQTNNSVTILKNNGDRTFTPQTPIPVGESPVSIASGVVMGGVLPDLIIANADSDTITILQYEGQGTYGVYTIPVGPKPIIVTPTDVDNDRDLDIVFSLEVAGAVGMIVNMGAQTFASPINLPVEGAPGSLASWDMDADGDQDVVAVVDDDTLQEPVIRLLRNDSTLTQLAYTLFDPIGAGEMPRLVNGSDVTGDTLEDLVSVNVVPLNIAMNGGGTDGPRNPSVAIRQTLLNAGPLCRADIAPPGTPDGTVGVLDLLFIINAWGPCVNPNNCPADIAPAGPPIGDDIVGVPDLLYIINNWGPCR